MPKRLTQEESDLKLRQLETLNRAVMISYVLGQAFLKNTAVMLHEMKHSPSQSLRMLGKIKQQHTVELHRNYKRLFNGAESQLDQAELEMFQEKIEHIISTLW